MFGFRTLSSATVLLLFSCTEYDLEHMDKSRPSGEEAAGENDGFSAIDQGEPQQDSGFEEAVNEEAEDDCVELQDGFDIESVSVLQDAAGYANGADAVILNFDTSVLNPGDTWRVSKVDILIMIPQNQFDYFADGTEVSAQVFDSTNPTMGQYWTVTLPIYKSDHNWQPITLPWDAAIAGQTYAYEQYGAWVSFDFSSVIPETGMSSSSYIAGAKWNPTGIPAVGYSNFNLDCSVNWTDYGDGVWILNSVNTSSQYQCSWPMMKVEIEINRADQCD